MKLQVRTEGPSLSVVSDDDSLDAQRDVDFLALQAILDDAEAYVNARGDVNSCALEASLDGAEVFRLWGNRFTADREVALAGLLTTRDTRAGELWAIAAAVLRLSGEAERRRSTTLARREFVRLVIAENLLPRRVGQWVLHRGGVSDQVWAELSKLRDFLEVSTAYVRFWTLTLRDGRGARLPLPVPYEPLEHAAVRTFDLHRIDPDPPLATLAAAVDRLDQEGWTQVALEEHHDSVGEGNLREEWITAVTVRFIRDRRAAGADFGLLTPLQS